MSRIFCIIDGMTDPGFRASEYAFLSKMELTDWVDTCRGQPPESFCCILHHLGIEAVPPFLRGYAEALGAGIPVRPGDLVVRGSWFSVDAGGRCTAPVPGPAALQLPGAAYYSLGQYKSIVVLPGAGEEIGQIATRPPFSCAGEQARSLRPSGCAALEALFDVCLDETRCLIPWAASVSGTLPRFSGRGAVITGTDVVRGIGLLLGMEDVPVPGATGEVDTDLPAKTAAALASAERVPFVLLHINGADEAGHRKDPGQKKRFLQKIDRQVLGPLLASGHRITVTSDHGTDPETGLHLGLPQPVFESKN